MFVTIAVMVGFAVFAGGLGKILPQSFLTDEDQGYFFMNIESPGRAAWPHRNKLTKTGPEMVG